MKIINEKGKLFGLINIVDLIVLLLVVAVIGVVGTKLMGSKVTDAVSAKADCWAQVRVAGAQPYLVEEVMRQELPGQRMVSGNEFLSGTVEIGDFKHWGKGLKTIEPLITQKERVVRVGEEAKESFDYLLDTKANYVIVLDDEDRLKGIITKSSVAQNVAESLWGGEL